MTSDCVAREEENEVKGDAKQASIEDPSTANTERKRGKYSTQKPVALKGQCRLCADIHVRQYHDIASCSRPLLRCPKMTQCSQSDHTIW